MQPLTPPDHSLERTEHAPQSVLILGPTNYAIDLVEIIDDVPGFHAVGFIECLERSRCDDQHANLPIYWVDDLDDLGGHHVAVCALGTTQRGQYIKQVTQHGISFATIVHPTAHVSPTAVLAEGVIVGAGCIMGAKAVIGRHVRLNRGVMVGHHTHVGDYATLQPGVNIAGDCRVEAGVYMGLSAVVLDGLRIGANSVVGAGAVVTKDVPDCVQVVGVPARIVKEHIDGK